MPTVLRLGPYRLFFYSADADEAPHVHVERDQSKAKFWLNPVAFYSSTGFRRSELLNIYRLISDNREILLRHWHDYFGN